MKAELSDVTKRVYLERIKYMLTTLKVDVFEIITHPPKYIAWIKDTFDALATQKSYMSAILAIFRHNDGLKQQEGKHYAAWFEAFQDVHSKIDERYKKNEPSQKQYDGYVSYDAIVKRRDELPHGSDERLILSFYTYIPPLRADLNRVRIYDKTPHATPSEPNYIILSDDNDATMILREYKTASSHDQYEKRLPAPLVKEIHQSLHTNPRDFLFQDRNGNAYRASSFTKWVNRTLFKVFGKHLTISLIRHSFINSLDFNALTVQEKENIAKDMAHTIATQDRYRLIFREKDHK